jgi:hypothetical protein
MKTKTRIEYEQRINKLQESKENWMGLAIALLLIIATYLLESL